MKRTLGPDERRMWALVAATVRPARGRPRAAAAGGPVAAAPPPEPSPKPSPPAPPSQPAKPPAPSAPPPRHLPYAIEPGRRRRIVRGREDIAVRLDLHGMNQDAARSTLRAFLRRAQADGYRAALVITGKGADGDGVLRRRVPEWLAEPALRALVAGVSTADRRHGGEGALYVAIKRPPALGRP